jgi:hypothetical protein
VVTLYGTIFASNAANSRIYADMCRLLGLFSREDHERRVALRRLFLILLTVVPAAMYLVLESPVKMVVAGGLAQAALLPALGAGTLHLHHRCLPRDVAPSRLVTVGLWVATLGMAVVTGYALFLAVRG